MPRLISKTYIEISGRGAMTQITKGTGLSKGMKKSCPRCPAKASTVKAVEEIFGLRNSNGHVIAQSLCRLCRSAHARVVREFKASNKKLSKVDLRSHKTGKGKKATLVKASTGKRLNHVVKTKAKKIPKVTKKVTKKIKSKKSKKKN